MSDIDVIQSFYQHQSHLMDQGAETDGVTLDIQHYQIARWVGTGIIVTRAGPDCPGDHRFYCQYIRDHPPSGDITFATALRHTPGTDKVMSL